MRARALALILCGLLRTACEAPAQGTDIRIIAPSAPGTGWDQVAQTLRIALAERGGLAAAVSNIPGGGGLTGLARFLTTESETDLLVTGLTMLDASLLSRSAADFDRLTPIARLSSDYFGIVVPANSTFRAIHEIGAALLADPTKLAWAGGPNGGVDHVAAILLARALGVPAQHLNYVPFLTSAEAGLAAAEEKVGAAMLALSEVHAELVSGRLRLLAVSSPDRLPGFDAPTLTESGIPLDFANWRGLAARPGLGRDQQHRLTALIQAALASPSWQETLNARKWQSAFLPPEPFQAFVRQEHQRVKEALRAAGLLKRGPAE
ncbi:Bug family tripartite tricarboxylate transporter substrate binding protein [Enterovirga aerilata]|uniref:Tripartite tricarboxylate transporter substrate binding protein n=1 Tax=Enterovirga aerilata TaxID=2730920 RepID=A0A849I464_9HYPH|nr:tripartite tricarboxylate transporter substrate-binding protein [Enterovirga sp. DB1703]NNM72464.1 tripartite tricarboxylate transporter substrate binding protein [Enterovirga sp. DB1703]